MRRSTSLAATPTAIRTGTATFAAASSVRAHDGADTSGRSGHGTSGHGTSGQGTDGRSTSGSATFGHGTSASSSFTRTPNPRSGNSTLPTAAATWREAYSSGCARANASRLAARVPAGGSNATGSLTAAVSPEVLSSAPSASSPASGTRSTQRAACPVTRPMASNAATTSSSPKGSVTFGNPVASASRSPSAYRRAVWSQPARSVSTSSLRPPWTSLQRPTGAPLSDIPPDMPPVSPAATPEIDARTATARRPKSAQAPTVRAPLGRRAGGQCAKLHRIAPYGSTVPTVNTVWKVIR